MEMTPEFKKNNFFVIILVSLFVLIAIIFVLIAYNKKNSVQSQKVEAVSEVGLIKNSLDEGDVGKVVSTESEMFENVITETYGVIQRIERDRVIVLGSGSNFEDGVEREITLLFVKETKVDDIETGFRHKGIEGLEYLEEGMVIDIVGVGNIKGKVEFEVDYIEKREE